MGWIKPRIEAAWRYKDLLQVLVSRDIKLKYRRSFLGYLWSVLNPLLVMIVMTIVFSSIFKSQIDNFPVYLFTGQLIFNYMSTCTNMCMDSIIGNAGLIKKAYVPKYVFVLSKAMSCMIDMVFSMAALIIVMIATGAKFSVYNLLFPFVLVQLFVFCLGLSLFLAQACVFFRDIKYIYNAIITAWVYFTPIFYPMDMLPDNVVWAIKHLNPMYLYVAQFRDIVFYNRVPGYAITLSGIIVAIIMLLVGVISFVKKQDNFILYM